MKTSTLLSAVLTIALVFSLRGHAQAATPTNAMTPSSTTNAPAKPAQELKVGDKAPDFTLKASDGKTYKLADFQGKKAVVLAWFPKAFTSGCTAECTSVKEHGADLKKFDVAYFTASVDPLEGPGGNIAFAKSLNVDYPILSDPTRETATAYGVLNGLAARRWTYYIGADGKILAIDKSMGTTTQGTDIIAKLKDLKIKQNTM